eukprot:5192465-Prymnesium_polylepis.1
MFEIEIEKKAAATAPPELLARLMMGAKVEATQTKPKMSETAEAAARRVQIKLEGVEALKTKLE